ncbi:pirin family protein [Vibrio sp. WXL210]|uniref:pirin family protein n=1 Tax=Vibrio sp. WXL210 TaxID=3450709 RepID=UPI003EC70AAA
MVMQRHIQKRLAARATADGDGVKIKRIAGFNLPGFSPFLMIDELKSDQSADYIGGFPPHPHRGIETLTYMLNGHFQHRDHLGHVGELKAGGAQWMAAGRGIIHSEMPIMTEGQLHGFQLWINQPADLKMTPAQYHDFQPETIREYSDDKLGLLRVIAGEVKLEQGVRLSGALSTTGVPLTVCDWQADKGQQADLELDENNHALIYVYRGKVTLSGEHLEQGEAAILSSGTQLSLASQDEAGALILYGQPIDEPIVHHGPFVMNTQEEINQAIADYQNGRFETY